MNGELATIMNKLSVIMQNSGQHMKARAYKKAEETILQLPREICTIEDVKGKPGIGKTMLRTIEEYIKTGKNKIIEANGLLAACVQHEIDHLDGILFIDYLSKLKKEIILKKALKKIKTENR